MDLAKHMDVEKIPGGATQVKAKRMENKDYLELPTMDTPRNQD